MVVGCDPLKLFVRCTCNGWHVPVEIPDGLGLVRVRCPDCLLETREPVPRRWSTMAWGEMIAQRKHDNWWRLER